MLFRSTIFLSTALAAGAGVSFNRDIRPILSNNCIRCHGPDEAERKGGPKERGGLRLDTAEGFGMDLGDGKRAVVPGKPQESELIARIITHDADELMPPVKSGKHLSAAEVKLLSDWITEGGVFSRHWSYEKPVRPPVPGAGHPVDAFVRERLAKEVLNPQPEADRATLIRRVTLDLTGLPPAPGEVEAFQKDQSPDAYERLVDRLLASPAYGEHMGRQWLDLARYADSAGYADDPPRTIWAYRDYVIRAFNANLPFDQFTIEQMAGDLLPQPTEDQLIATAFHRNTMTNSEGGTNDEEFRNAAVVDRVNTTVAVWMGTSMACAQCHTHKYDPITQHEYFQVFAFLNNSEDADRRDESPLHSFLGTEQKAVREKLDADIAAVEAKLNAPGPELLAAAEKWTREFSPHLAWQVLKPGELKSQAKLEMKAEADGAVSVPATAAKDTYTISLPAEQARTFTALRLEALASPSLPGMGPGHGGGNFVLTAVRAEVQKPEGGSLAVTFTDAAADFEQPGFFAESVIAPPANEPKKRKKARDQRQGWAVGGAPGKDHALTLLTSAPVELPAGAKLIVTVEMQSPHANHTLGRFRLSATGDARAAEVVELPADTAQALAIPAAQRTAEQQKSLAGYYTRERAPEFDADRTKLAALKKQHDALQPDTVPIMRDLPEKQRRTTKVQLRGNWQALGDQVDEGVPAAWHPLPPGAPKNRLTLARWLVSEDNPLTARVTVNRFWETLFGTGLVRTSEEFGSQGEQPSHPELLDWLAVEFMAQKWNVKSMLKLLVTSATYRQSSRVEPGMAERDPDNRLLARGPRIRLSAEMVRDQALAVSGLLSGKMFGPPVRPQRPSMGLSAAFGGGLDWQTSSGEDRFRRALYTEWRRTSPYPSMTTFDAPNREVCTLRRNRTNTPLQALVTLNDPVFVEAAQALARRVSVPADAPEEIIRRALQLVVSRTPTEREMQRLRQLYEESLTSFRADAKRAAEMATNPIGPVPAGADTAALAAWTTVTSVLLNLDETIMRR